MRAAFQPPHLRKRHPRSFSTRNSTELWQCLETTNERVKQLSMGMPLPTAMQMNSAMQQVSVTDAMKSTEVLRDDGISTAYSLNAILARPNSRGVGVKRTKADDSVKYRVQEEESEHLGVGVVGEDLVRSFGDKSIGRMSSQTLQHRVGGERKFAANQSNITMHQSGGSLNIYNSVRGTPQREPWIAASPSVRAQEAWGLNGSRDGRPLSGARRQPGSMLDSGIDSHCNNNQNSKPLTSTPQLLQNRSVSTTSICPLSRTAAARPQTREQRLLAKRMAYGADRPISAAARYRALPKGSSMELRRNGYKQFNRDVTLSDAQAEIEEKIAIGAEEETTAAQRIEHSLRKMEIRRAEVSISEEGSILSPRAAGGKRVTTLSSVWSSSTDAPRATSISPPGSPLSGAVPAEMSAIFGPEIDDKKAEILEFHFNDLPEARLHYGSLVALEVRQGIFVTMERPDKPGQHSQFKAKHEKDRHQRDEWVFRIIDLLNPDSNAPVCWDNPVWLKVGGESFKPDSSVKENLMIIVLGAKVEQPQTLPVVVIDAKILKGFKSSRDDAIETCGVPTPLTTTVRKSYDQNRQKSAKGDNIGKWKIRSTNAALRSETQSKNDTGEEGSKKKTTSNKDNDTSETSATKEHHILNFTELFLEQDFFYLASDIANGEDDGALTLRPYNEGELGGATPDRPAVFTLRIIQDPSSGSSKDQKKAFAVTSEATALLSQSILNRNGGRKYISKKGSKDSRITGGSNFTRELREEIANAAARSELEHLMPHMEKEESMQHLVVADQYLSQVDHFRENPMNFSFEDTSNIDGGISTLPSVEESHHIFGVCNASVVSAAINELSTPPSPLPANEIQGKTFDKMEMPRKEAKRRVNILDRINDRMDVMDDADVDIVQAEIDLVIENTASGNVTEPHSPGQKSKSSKWNMVSAQKVLSAGDTSRRQSSILGKGPGRQTRVIKNFKGRPGATFNLGNGILNLLSLLKKDIDNMDQAIEKSLKKHFDIKELRSEMRMTDNRTKKYIDTKAHRSEMKRIMEELQNRMPEKLEELDSRMRYNRQKQQQQEQEDKKPFALLESSRVIDVAAALQTFGANMSLLATMINSVCSGYVNKWEPSLSKSLRNLQFQHVKSIMSILNIASKTFGGTGFRDAAEEVSSFVEYTAEQQLRTVSQRMEVRHNLAERLEELHSMMIGLAQYPPVLIAAADKMKADEERLKTTALKTQKAADESIKKDDKMKAKGNAPMSDAAVLALAAGKHTPGWRKILEKTTSSRG